MQHFKNPDNSYRIFPILHDLTVDGDENRIDNEIQNVIADTGGGGTVTNAAWTPEWLTDEKNIQNLRTAARKIRERDFGLWIYDEYWYPSGWANGFAIREHPENAARNIAFLHRKGKGKSDVKICLPEGAFEFVAAGFYPVMEGKPDFSDPTLIDLGNQGIDCDGADCSWINCSGIGGEWLFLAFYIRPHNASHGESTRKEELPGGYREVLNFLNKSAVDTFIQVALDPMTEKIKEFPLWVDAIFTDEPSLMSMYYTNTDWTRSFNSVPWGDQLFTEYKKQFGISLETVLPYLFFDDTEIAKTIRVQYYRLISDFMLNHFTRNVADWCHAHQVKYSGHLLLEEALYYHVGFYADFMKTMSGMDIPGFDILTADSRKFWEKGNAFGSSWCFAGKYASSVSRIKGHNTTMLEICPYIDTAPFEEDPFREFMALMTFCTFTGATHINAYRFTDMKDPVKCREWNDYTARITMMLRESVSNCRIAVYYPIADAQAAFTATGTDLRAISPRSYELNDLLENMTMVLYENKMDYNFLTEEALLNSRTSGKTFLVSGIEYDSLILPSVTILPLAVMKKITEMVCSGVNVFFIDQIPQMGVGMPEHEEVRKLAHKVCNEKNTFSFHEFGKVTHVLRSTAQNPLVINGEDVFISQYRRQDNDLYYIITPGTEDQKIKVTLPDDGKITLYQPLTGETETLRTPADITVRAGRGIFIEYRGKELS